MIDQYNESVAIDVHDTTNLLNTLQQQDQRDIEKELKVQKIRSQVVSHVIPETVDSSPAPRIQYENKDTSPYASRLHTDDQKKNKKIKPVQLIDTVKEEKEREQKLSNVYKEKVEKPVPGELTEAEKIAEAKYTQHLEIIDAYKSSSQIYTPVAEQEEVEVEELATGEDDKPILEYYKDVKDGEATVDQRADDRNKQTLNDYYDKVKDKSKKSDEQQDTSILEYYKQANAKKEDPETDPTEYLGTFDKEEDKETAKEELAEKVERQKQDVEDKEVDRLADSLEKSEDIIGEGVVAEETDPTEYLDLFSKEEQKDKKKRQRKRAIEDQVQRVITEESERRENLQRRYDEQLARLTKSEESHLKYVEQKVQEREEKLLDAYKRLLAEDATDYDDFYSPDYEYDVTSSIDTKTVTVANQNTDVSHSFNYHGTLTDIKLSGYQLRMNSMVKEDIGLVNVPDARGFVTHVQTVFDIRDRSIVEHLTFVFNKFDATLLEENADVEDYPDNKVGTTSYGTAYWSFNPVWDPSAVTTVTYTTSADHPIEATEMQDETHNFVNSLSSAASYTNLNVTTGANAASIYLERKGGTTGAVEVAYCTLDGESSNAASNALAGTDYTGVTGSVMWDNSQDGAIALTGININEDYESEGESRTFFVYISALRAVSDADGTYTSKQSFSSAGKRYTQTNGFDMAKDPRTGLPMDRRIPITIQSRHHGFFTFTTGIGSSWCPNLSTWNSGYHKLSAVAPDGVQRGFVDLGVERLSGTYGDVTVRYLVSAGMPPFVTDTPYTANYPYTDTDVFSYTTGDYTIDFDTSHLGLFSNAVGDGAFTYAGEDAEQEVSFVSGGNGLSLGRGYNPLSAEDQVLTWAHGEGGVKNIRLYHGGLGDAAAAPAAAATPNTGVKRWYAVYLTFDASYRMGLSAATDGAPLNQPGDAWQRSCRVPTVCATIAGLAHGQARNSHNNSIDSVNALSTGFRGSTAAPFYIAISGFSDQLSRQNYCHPGGGY